MSKDPEFANPDLVSTAPASPTSGLPFLLEIGAEEIPDWMIPGALENLRTLFEETVAKAGMPAQSVAEVFQDSDQAGSSSASPDPV